MMKCRYCLNKLDDKHPNFYGVCDECYMLGLGRKDESSKATVQELKDRLNGALKYSKEVTFVELNWKGELWDLNKMKRILRGIEKYGKKI